MAANTTPVLSTSAVCFRRDAFGDLLFPLELATGLEAVAIGIRTRLLLVRGEWFLDLSVGIPMLPGQGVTDADAILGRRFDPIKTRAAFLGEILTTPGVFDVPIFRMQFEPADRVLSISWVARTQFGDTELDTLDFNI